MKKMLLTVALLGIGGSLLADCCNKRSCGSRCEPECGPRPPKCVKYVKKCVKPCKRVECETIYSCPPGTREEGNGE